MSGDTPKEPRRSKLRHVFAITSSVLGLTGACAAAYIVADKSFVWLGQGSYADVIGYDGSRRHLSAQGLHVLNPLNTAGIAKWTPQSQMLPFMSWPEEKDYLKIEMQVSYTGLDALRTHSAVRWPARAAGNAALKDIFRQHGWMSYGLVNPEKFPANAGILCAELGEVIKASADPHYVRAMKVDNCTITARDRERPRSRYIPG